MLSYEMAQALRRADLPKKWFGWFERAGDDLYAWNGEHDIRWNGQTWKGVGHLLDLASVDKGDALSFREQEFTLSGLDPTELSGMNEDVSDRGAKLWFGVLNTAGQVVRDPILVHVMTQNYLKRRISDDGTVSLTLNCSIALPRFDQPTGKKWSHENQQVRFTGDEGCYYLSINAQVGMTGLDWRPA